MNLPSDGSIVAVSDVDLNRAESTAKKRKCIAYQDYRKMLDLVRPQFFIPVHGEYRHLVLHGQLAEEAGVDRENVFVVEDGETVEFGHFTGNGAITAEQLPSELGDVEVFDDLAAVAAKLTAR